MEKEVRAMLDKGEKVTLVAIYECVMNGNENQKALITNKEYEIIDFCEGMFCIDSEITSKHEFYIENINKYFKLKQPKDLNPEKKTKKERIEELEKRVEQLESDFKDFCSYVEFKILEPDSSEIQKQNIEDAKSMVNDKYELWKFFVDEHNLTLLDVKRLCDGHQIMNLIINRELSGGYCKTAVSRWPFSQHK